LTKSKDFTIAEVYNEDNKDRDQEGGRPMKRSEGGGKKWQSLSNGKGKEGCHGTLKDRGKESYQAKEAAAKDGFWIEGADVEGGGRK